MTWIDILLIFSPSLLIILYVAVRLCVDPKYRAEAERDAERIKKERAAKKAARYKRISDLADWTISHRTLGQYKHF